MLGRWRQPLVTYAYVAAIVAGVLLALGRYLAGAILVVVALILLVGRQIMDRRKKTTEPGIW